MHETFKVKGLKLIHERAEGLVLVSFDEALRDEKWIPYDHIYNGGRCIAIALSIMRYHERYLTLGTGHAPLQDILAVSGITVSKMGMPRVSGSLYGRNSNRSLAIEDSVVNGVFLTNGDTLIRASS